MKIACVGDVILSREPRGENARLISEILKSCDAAVGNLECSLFDGAGVAVGDADGLHLRAPAARAADIAALGITAVTRANNHTMDYGWEAVQATTGHLDSVGISSAGVGPTIEAAARCSVRRVSQGTVGVVAVTATARAKDLATSDRPGVYGLKCDSVDGGSRRLAEEDLTVLAERIAHGRRDCDVLLFAVHSHHAAGHPSNVPFGARRLARFAIERGADLVAFTGPHVLRGIECWGHGLVMYGMGNFAFELEGIPSFPAVDYRRYGVAPDESVENLHASFTIANGGAFNMHPEFWRSIIAETVFDDGGLAGIIVRPIALGRNAAFGERGSPALAAGGDAEFILRSLRERSPGTMFDDFVDDLGHGLRWKAPSRVPRRSTSSALHRTRRPSGP